MIRRILSALLVALIASAPVAVAADVIKMNLNAIYPAGNFHSQGAAEFAKRVKEYTGGTVDITVHPGGSLGFKGPELLKVVKDGTVPMSDILMGVVQGSEKAFGISSLPRLVTSYEEALTLYNACKPLYDKAAAKWNQKILYVAPWPPSGLFTKKEILTTADIKGIKTRTYDKNGADFLTNLGGKAVSLPWGEVYAALRTGMIDSVLTSAVSGRDAKLWEVLKYFKRIEYAYPLNMVVINLDYWNGLSAEQKAAMEKAAAELQELQWEKSRSDNEEALKVIAENGIAISETDEALAKDLDAAAEAIIRAFLKDAGPEVAAVVENFRKSQ
ncbi:TRAP-type C4-dicarboxylate transport system, substrate-binding protein [Desulfacinum infernum DSM 9756]|uniref:TRAP-type C4-dicarboxylate transport system, substrate-binding protein n=1 Tax=Desulfacinum infernum DSM 9756 TaxID=1121391 RepID=A0A1M4Z294_9BACT|nr:TRAP transporter substrate-binding protein [Desulfacinum infernum]SHF12161.1 TRAP-type C4-dicarboxylate transport system, substrate-binding protein [Desulfacinum infernum DSM 9756]